MCTINIKVKLPGNLLNPICIYHPHSISYYIYIFHRYSISQKLSFICTLLSLFFWENEKKCWWCGVNWRRCSHLSVRTTIPPNHLLSLHRRPPCPVYLAPPHNHPRFVFRSPLFLFLFYFFSSFFFVWRLV